METLTIFDKLTMGTLTIIFETLTKLETPSFEDTDYFGDADNIANCKH